MYEIKIVGVIGKDFKVNDLAEHLQKADNDNDVKLWINSPGGYLNDGLQMFDMLTNSKKNIHAENTGDVASAAVPVFLSAPLMNRFFDEKLGIFLIHNTWIDGISGTAEDLLNTADEMQRLEKQLVNIFAKQTGSNPKYIESLMKSDLPLTGSQIETFKFSNLKNKNMNTVLNQIENLFKKFLPETEKQPEIKNFFLQDATGQELKFPDEITEASQITIGITATVGGQPANGEYIMADGSVMVFDNGTLTDIKMPVDNEKEELKEQVKTLTSNNLELQNKLNEFQSELKKLKQIYNLSNKTTEVNTPSQPVTEAPKVGYFGKKAKK